MKSALRLFVEENPEATTEELMKKFKIEDKQKIYQVRNAIKRSAPSEITSPEGLHSNGEQLQLTITVPDSGIVIKLAGKNMLGTLEVSSQGLMFIKANGKKRPEKPLQWRILQALQESGM